jgi:LmbE family N-acetylglucosaminyl deacetylase
MNTQTIRRILFLTLLIALPLRAQQTKQAQESSQPPQSLPAPDERFKTDILVVVAHPDDEGAASPYLARAIDEGKRVAIAYGTRGGNGANQVGTEQAGALADIREIEARRAVASLGITNVWFLGGSDTASQNLLQSLTSWGHGAALENLVRIVRLTRPEIIMTFLPAVFIGENHGDHQAAGVLATEAFDLAGDPAEFASQVAGPTKRLESYLENLHPWQAKKLYYFGFSGHDAEFKSAGPSYSVTGISKTQHIPYWRVALNSWSMHETQSKAFVAPFAKMSDAEVEKAVTAQQGSWASEHTFVLGKSQVGGSVTGDLFENISSTPLPAATHATRPAANAADVSVELGGPWSFYQEFRREHGTEHIPQIATPESAVQAGGSMYVPLWLHNPTDTARDITLTATVPQGWTVQTGAATFSVRANDTEATRVEIAVPELPGTLTTSAEISEVTVTATSNGKTVGVIKLHVQLRKRALPQ